MQWLPWKMDALTRQRLVAVVGVIVLAALVRLAAALVFHCTPDEQGGWRTIEGLLRGEHFIYLYHSRYLGLGCEYISVVLFKWFGPSLLALRIPYIFFGALAAGFWWWILAPLLPSRVHRMALAVFLAFPSFSNMAYEVPGPSYSLGRFLIAGMVWMTLRFPKHPQWGNYIGFSLYSGAAIYILPLCKVPFLLCLIWLAVRDGAFWAACVSAWKRGRDWEKWIFGAAGSGAILFLGAGVYHYLTRPGAGYHMPGWIAKAWGLGIVLALVSGGLLLKRVSWRWLTFLPVVASLVLALGVVWVPDRLFCVEWAKLSVEERIQYGEGGDLVVEHAHNWPVRSAFTVQHIIPQIFMGTLAADNQRAGSGYATDFPIVPWRLALGMALLAVVTVGVIRGLQNPESRGVMVIMGTSVLLVMALFMTTYKSANLYNYRYLGLFSPGLFLAVVAAFRSSRVSAVLVVLMTVLGCLDMVMALLGSL